VLWACSSLVLSLSVIGVVSVIDDVVLTGRLLFSVLVMVSLMAVGVLLFDLFDGVCAW
jgi:hypothetical protein